jgi:REP element-mobilizing transposase RayT
MPRQLRVEMAGAFYHVLARGDRREAIYLNPEDCEDWLSGLGRVCQRLGWRVHAWVLMGNHYHFLVETPEPNLVRGMRELQQGYTQHFNRRHGLSGHLFGGRYKAILIDEHVPEHPGNSRRRERARSADHADYFLMVADYIHLNPVRAQMVKLSAGSGLLGYAWSSLSREYAQPVGKRHGWMAVERVLAGWNLEDTAKGRHALVERLEELALDEGTAHAGLALPEGQSLQATLRRGWYFGRQEFAERLLHKLKQIARLGRKGEHYEGASLRRAHGKWEAERLVQVGLRKLAVKPGRIRRGDQSLVALAEHVRARTGVPLGWLAERLQLRNAANLTQRLIRLKTESKVDPVIRRLRRELCQL